MSKYYKFNGMGVDKTVTHHWVNSFSDIYKYKLNFDKVKCCSYCKFIARKNTVLTCCTMKRMKNIVHSLIFIFNVWNYKSALDCTFLRLLSIAS